MRPQPVPEGGDVVAIIEAHEGRLEFLDGRLYNGAGGSVEHYRLESALFGFLVRQSRRGCSPYTGNVPIRFPGGHILSPDASFAFDARFERDRIDFLKNPAVVFEVVSAATASHEGGRKAELYRSVPSLRAYVLLWTESPRIEIYERGEDEWTSRLLVGYGAEAVLPPFTEPLRTDEPTPT